jgi:hypothetical protein
MFGDDSATAWPLSPNFRPPPFPTSKTAGLNYLARRLDLCGRLHGLFLTHITRRFFHIDTFDEYIDMELKCQQRNPSLFRNPGLTRE